MVPEPVHPCSCERLDGKVDRIHEDLGVLHKAISDVRVEVAENRSLSQLSHNRMEKLEQAHHEATRTQIKWVFGVAGTVIATIAATVITRLL